MRYAYPPYIILDDCRMRYAYPPYIILDDCRVDKQSASTKFNKIPTITPPPQPTSHYETLLQSAAPWFVRLPPPDWVAYDCH